MANFWVCRIYKVTVWLNFSYNCSVNLLQIFHLYIHPLCACYLLFDLKRLPPRLRFFNDQIVEDEAIYNP